MIRTGFQAACGALVAAGLALPTGIAAAAELNPKALVFKLPDQIPWRDLGGTASTAEFANAICRRLAA